MKAHGEALRSAVLARRGGCARPVARKDISRSVRRRAALRLRPRCRRRLEPLKTRNDLKITDLRTIAVQGLVEAQHLPPLAEAKALLGWHARHRFCPNCGAPTHMVQGGWRRDCPSCGAEHFPRTDPVVIMLVIAGERCVLGRSRRFAPTMWSCLAGFVEPGETIEEAVRREVWRKPASLRPGEIFCLAAVAVSVVDDDRLPRRSAVGDIVVDRERVGRRALVRARGIGRDAARAHPQGLTTPPPVAIAHHIIRDYVEDGADVLR